MFEFEYYNGENYITFYCLQVNEEKQTALFVVSDNGKISQKEFDLFNDKKGTYIEYGNSYNKIYFNKEI